MVEDGSLVVLQKNKIKVVCELKKVSFLNSEIIEKWMLF
jgi:hypothetical protein